MARKKENARPQHAPSRGAIAATTLRIIGGRLRGRQFTYHGDPTTRPMKQRVREAAFNLIGPRVRGTHVVDLFAGTGALAWEALSRGAATATLIERHFPTARQIDRNAAALDLVDRVEVHAGDTFIWLQHHLTNTLSNNAARRWLVFCSPPYEMFVSRHDAMVALIDTLASTVPPGSLLIVEADTRFDMARLSRRMTWDIRSYLPAVLAVGEQEETAAGS